MEGVTNLILGIPTTLVSKNGMEGVTNLILGIPVCWIQDIISPLSLPALMERLSKIKDTDLSKLKEALARNPHLQERLSLPGQGVRNQYDEARRMNIDQMRELQR